MKLKLGVIGFSPGNGHPFSWSAIFNGYDLVYMNRCGYPVIPNYLEKQKFPNDFLNDIGEVIAVWSQDENLSNLLSKASKVPIVCQNIEDLIQYCDAVILARDDGENHLDMALPFLNEGTPVFIDKPFALSLKDAKTMLSKRKNSFQLFSCSSLRYAEELKLNQNEMEVVRSVEAFCPKFWDTYSPHLIDPILFNTPFRGKLINIEKNEEGKYHTVNVEWENFKAKLHLTGEINVGLFFNYFDESNNVIARKDFKDTFNCFKKSLETFCEQISEKDQKIQDAELLELVKIIQYGR